MRGVDPDLRVRPFYAQAARIVLREFIVGALNDEMGIAIHDPELAAASSGARVVTPGGFVMDGALDTFAAAPAGPSETDPCVVDYLEFYLLNYFKPGTYEQSDRTERGRRIFDRIGCTACHVPDLPLNRDRRVADVETRFDPDAGSFNGLYATATALCTPKDDQSGAPPLQVPQFGPFLVKDIFTDFKRHDLGSGFYERNYNGTVQTAFMTAALWGVGSTSPYGHDGRSINLTEVILRHGGEALQSAKKFELLPEAERRAVREFLESLILFPPDDTASNLNPANPGDPNYPQVGHGSIKLGALFNDPTDPE